MGLETGEQAPSTAIKTFTFFFFFFSLSKASLLPVSTQFSTIQDGSIENLVYRGPFQMREKLNANLNSVI